MPSLLRLAFVAACALHTSLAGIIPLDATYAVKESIEPPRGWIKQSAPSPDSRIVLKIALPQPNFHELEKHLYEVSDPDHERYGQHLSKEEVEQLVAPHPESISTVDAWLSTFGLTEADFSRSPARDWITLRVPIRIAEKMLDTTYHVWEHVKSGDSLVRTTSYSLPSHLHGHVDLIQPTTMFARFKPEKSDIFKVVPVPEVQNENNEVAKIVDAASGVTVDASCNNIITITCLQQIYNAVGFTPSQADNSIGITGYLEQFANKQDLQSFFKDQRPDAVNSTFKVVSVKGGLNNQTLDEAGDEADLDVQFAFGISHPVSPTFFTTAGRAPFTPDIGEEEDFNEPYTDWLDFILAHPNPPLAISTSYGDDEQTVPFNFAVRACNGFAQLVLLISNMLTASLEYTTHSHTHGYKRKGARGVSLMFSSGDGGVGDGDEDPATQECFSNDGKNTTKFLPGFPASCPFVTAVGGTTGFPEVAVSRFFSGGGFSNFFSRPSYQDKDVSAYLAALPKGTYAGLFNPKGRAFPDVSAQSDLFKVFIGGQAFLIGGTSASSPAFTGFVALLNDVRLKAKLPPLGFLNPFLYSKGFKGLNDITVGNNGGCGTPGFNASKGWDPVTGLGTPNFGLLKDLVLKN